MHKIGDLQVKFQYYDWLGDRPEREETPTDCGCSIYEGENIVSWGESHCHPNDNFSYRTARKIAFGRALKELFDNKEERAYFWEEYFRLFPKDRVKIGK